MYLGLCFRVRGAARYHRAVKKCLFVPSDFAAAVRLLERVGRMGSVAAALAATPYGGLARKTVATAARAENPQHPIGVENQFY